MICLEVLHQQYDPYETLAGNTEGFKIILTHVSGQILSLLQTRKWHVTGILHKFEQAQKFSL